MATSTWLRPTQMSVVFAATLVSADLLVQRLAAAGVASGNTQLFKAAFTTAVILASVWLLHRRIGGRSWRELGFTRPPHAAWSFLFGAAYWTMFAATAVAVGVKLGYIDLVLVRPELGDLTVLMTHGAIVFLYEALPEETALRGYIFTDMRRSLGTVAAVLSQSAFFVCIAFAAVVATQLRGGSTSWVIGWDRLILLFTFGTTLALLRLWSGSLWAAIGFHTAYQTAIQLLVADRFPGVTIADGRSMNEVGIFTWLGAIAVGGLIALAAVLSTARSGSSSDSSHHNSATPNP